MYLSINYGAYKIECVACIRVLAGILDVLSHVNS